MGAAAAAVLLLRTPCTLLMLVLIIWAVFSHFARAATVLSLSTDSP
jgi:hypothetical protein